VQLIGKSNKNISLLHYGFKGPNIKLPPTMAEGKNTKKQRRDEKGKKKSRMKNK
jgi:hypothetical protein